MINNVQLFPTFFRELVQNSDKLCCGGGVPEEKGGCWDSNVFLFCHYYIIVPLRWMIFGTLVWVLHAALIPLSVAVYGLAWIFPILGRVLTLPSLGCHTKVLTVLVAPASLAVTIVGSCLGAIWMGGLVSLAVMTDFRHGRTCMAFQLLTHAVHDVSHHYRDLYVFVRDLGGNNSIDQPNQQGVLHMTVSSAKL